MSPFIVDSLMRTGAVPFMDVGSTLPDWNAGPQGYVGGYPMGTLDAVDASDVYVDGARYTQAGVLRLYDATSALPAQVFMADGVAFTSTGQLCITTDAPTSASMFISGMAVKQDGAVHAQVLEPAAWYRYWKGITSAASLVSSWADQSGNSRPLLQVTGTNQPALQSDGSILFDGNDNYLKAVAFTLVQPETIYFLGKQITWTNNDSFFDGNTLESGRLRQGTVSSPNIAIDLGTPTFVNTGPALDTYAVICTIINGASSLIQVNNLTPATGNPGAGDMGGFTLGANGTPNQYGHIQVKEVILFPTAHSADLRSRVIRGLQNVGGLS